MSRALIFQFEVNVEILFVDEWVYAPQFHEVRLKNLQII